MSVITVGADYFGNVLKSVKHQNGISATRMAHLFGCDINQLHRYEAGTDLIPRDVLYRIFKYAAMLDKMLQDNPLR